MGIIAAALVSLNVVSLALAWGFGDITGKPHSLSRSPREAPLFYAVYAVVVALGALTVQLVKNLAGLVEIPDQARQSSFPFARFPLHLPPSGEPTGLQTSRLNCIEQAQNKAKLPY